MLTSVHMALVVIEQSRNVAMQRSRKNKYKIPVWKNGRIEYEIPGIITEQDTQADHPSGCNEGKRGNRGKWKKESME